MITESLDSLGKLCLFFFIYIIYKNKNCKLQKVLHKRKSLTGNHKMISIVYFLGQCIPKGYIGLPPPQAFVPHPVVFLQYLIRKPQQAVTQSTESNFLYRATNSTCRLFTATSKYSEILDLNPDSTSCKLTIHSCANLCNFFSTILNNLSWIFK